ncbi:uncharacterized protein [Nicotiana sylvestris]|uniref:uncharacterized protein n=1 Tax=Nicotiana sylvestris TaxID=4096 RepID=UPI00388C6E49
MEGLDLKSQETMKQNVKITLEDIKKEVEYWINSIIWYVLGSNPPPAVMSGYFHRIWGKMRIDKVVQVNRGVFLVGFIKTESRAKAVEDGVQIFDKKPVIVKPWSPDIDTRKEAFNKVPIWIRLPRLDIKYWDQPYPQSVIFENEVGKIIEQRVYYEWKPTLCQECNNYGHEKVGIQEIHPSKEAEGNINGKEPDQSKVVNMNKGTQQIVGQNNKGGRVNKNAGQQGLAPGASVQKGNSVRINSLQRVKGGPSTTLNLVNSFGAMGEANSMEMIEQGKNTTKQKQQSVKGDPKQGKGGGLPPANG